MEQDRDELQKTFLEEFIKGKDKESLISELRRSVGEDAAQQICNAAMLEYENLKQSGRLYDYEYDLHFSPARNRLSTRERFGAIFIWIGIFSVIILFFVGAPQSAFALPGSMLVSGFLMYILSPVAEKVEGGDRIRRLLRNPFWG